MIPIRVISGGQTGVDQAALRAAKACGLATGGYVPLGWLTEDGPAPWLRREYGLTQMPTKGYADRTRANIDSARATLILDDVADHSELEGGTKLTFWHAYRAGERGAGLFLADLLGDMLAECLDWLRECLAAADGGWVEFVLNVAGPRESKSPGIGARAEAFLTNLFRRLS